MLYSVSAMGSILWYATDYPGVGLGAQKRYYYLYMLEFVILGSKDKIVPELPGAGGVRSRRTDFCLTEL